MEEFEENGGDLESSDGDDDRDFDFGEHSAQKDLPGLLVAEGPLVRCNWMDPTCTSEEEEENRKKAKVDPASIEESERAALAQLHAAASTAERLQLMGPCYPEILVREKRSQPSAIREASITRAISDSLANRLTVLRVDNFPGSGDPIFGTRHELRRSLRAPDLFGKLTAAFRSGSCSLKRLTLQKGFHSAESLAKFLRVAKPSLESFRCRACLFHGRNFEMLVKALSTCSTELLEFETDAAIGGNDPFGLLADSFPNLRMLRVKYMFGQTDRSEGLRRLAQLKKRWCKLPREDHKLSGHPAVDVNNGIVYWGISSAYHDDGYRGEGLWWDELENTCECMEVWHVGKGVTKEHCLEFMEECGIDLDDGLNDEECGMLDEDDLESAVDSEGEQDTIVMQLELGDTSDTSTMVISATTMDGRKFAEVTLDPEKTLVRTLVEELSVKYPCSPLAVRLVIQNGPYVDAVEKGGCALASVLKKEQQ